MSLYFGNYPVIHHVNLIANSTGDRRARFIAIRAMSCRMTLRMNRRAWRNRFKGTPEEQRQRRARLAAYGVRVVQP